MTSRVAGQNGEKGREVGSAAEAVGIVEAPRWVGPRLSGRTGAAEATGGEGGVPAPPVSFRGLPADPRRDVLHVWPQRGHGGVG